MGPFHDPFKKFLLKSLDFLPERGHLRSISGQLTEELAPLEIHGGEEDEIRVSNYPFQVSHPVFSQAEMSPRGAVKYLDVPPFGINPNDLFGI